MDQNVEDAGKEQRKHTRLTIDIGADVTLQSREKISGRTKNISFGGAFVLFDKEGAAKLESLQEDATDKPCVLHLCLGDDSDAVTIEVNCMLVRRTATGFAVQFQSTTIEGYWHFKNLMVYNSPEAESLLEELEVHPGLSIN